MREEFTVRQVGPRKGHLGSYCKPCASKRNSEAAQRDPTTYYRIQRPSKLKRMYGITADDYYAMLKSQDGGCAVCGSKNPRARGYKKNNGSAFCVDHCHSTGRVRGLLCTACNRALGLIRDDPSVAAKMADYLRKGD